MNDKLREALDTIHQIIADAKKERDRYGYIAATIRVNALCAGASDEETEAMVRGDKPFIDWLAKQYEAKRLEDAAAPQPAPVPADERAAMIEVMDRAFNAWVETSFDSPQMEYLADALLTAGWTRGGAEAGLREALSPEDREWIDARADHLFRDSERQRGGIRPATIMPQDFRDYFVAQAAWERARAALAAMDTPKGGGDE